MTTATMTMAVETTATAVNHKARRLGNQPAATGRLNPVYTSTRQFIGDHFFWRLESFMPESLDQGELDGLRELNSQVIGAVYDKYFPEVFRYVRYRLGDEQAAEDIASDVFIRLLEASQKGRGPETNLRSWLLGTASHIITDCSCGTWGSSFECTSK